MKTMRNKKLPAVLLALFLALLTFITACSVSQEQAEAVLNIAAEVLAETETETPAPTAKTAKTAAPTKKAKSTQKAKSTKKATVAPTAAPTAVPEPPVREDGRYSSKEDVALYIYLFGHLPENFITKSEAEALGWPGGSLEPYAPGCSIGGDRFGNREGLLPKKSGRSYTECDIDTMGARSRGAKRIVFSNDGLIYYTDDHYETFTLLYGEA